MSEQYKKIAVADVLRVLMSIESDPHAPIDCINLVNIASLLQTSRYQVKKHIEILRDAGAVRLVCQSIADEYEVYPPYWGYQITEAVRIKNKGEQPQMGSPELIMYLLRDVYQKEKERHDTAMQKACEVLEV